MANSLGNFHLVAHCRAQPHLLVHSPTCLGATGCSTASALPCRDSADSLRDFYYSVAYNRVQGATNLMLEAWHWLRSHHPYW